MPPTPYYTLQSPPPSSQPLVAESHADGIALHGVSARRGSHTVLHDVRVQLDPGRIGLIGDNGAGKTSLLRLLVGLDEPAAGEVLVCGQAAHTHAPGVVGMMFQNPDEQIIFPTVEEELAFGLTALGVARALAAQRARDLLASQGLAHWTQRAVATLSQGQRQWLCWLAMTIVEPQWLLLDEPYASLDLPSQRRLRLAIEAQPRVIVSTHQLDHVRHWGRVIWLHQGRVMADGMGTDVCAAYESYASSEAPGYAEPL